MIKSLSTNLYFDVNYGGYLSALRLMTLWFTIDKTKKC